jgi:hypothetical protein
MFIALPKFDSRGRLGRARESGVLVCARCCGSLREMLRDTALPPTAVRGAL